MTQRQGTGVRLLQCEGRGVHLVQRKGTGLRLLLSCLLVASLARVAQAVDSSPIKCILVVNGKTQAVSTAYTASQAAGQPPRIQIRTGRRLAFSMHAQSTRPGASFVVTYVQSSLEPAGKGVTVLRAGRPMVGRGTVPVAAKGAPADWWLYQVGHSPAISSTDFKLTVTAAKVPTTFNNKSTFITASFAPSMSSVKAVTCGFDFFFVK